jgi:hypothetical protein
MIALVMASAVACGGGAMTDPVTKAPRYLMCEGKEGFSSPAVAAKVARKFNASKKLRHKAKAGKVESYRCRYCGLYHLGRRPRA